jgi:hypothetical protein
MSTPLNNLPLKTQQSNEDNNDINDPLVQDVLNEFQEELNSSKKQFSPEAAIPVHLQPSFTSQNQQVLPQQMHATNIQQTQMNIQARPNMQNNYYPQQNKYSINYNQTTFPYSYIDVDIVKKTAVIVIITILVFHTNIFLIIYDKLPDYIKDAVYKFDIYVRGIFLFVVIYALGLFEYI